MESQKPLAAEGFLTLFTLIGPLPGMNSLVLDEMALVVEGFLAFVTFKGLPACMSFLMSKEM